MIDVPAELTTFLREEYDRCVDTVLEQDREEALDRYNGEPYGDEEDGSSQVVARDTAETIDYMVISILRTLVSGQRVVEFTNKDMDAAHEATETMMYLFMEAQDGYMILHDWLKAGLLEKNAIAMTYGEPQPKKRIERQLPGVLVDPTVHKEAEPTGEMDPITGTPMFNVVELQPQPAKFCDAAVPNEEFYCSPDARTITEAALKGRRVRKSISDLIAMGIDHDDAEALPSVSMTDSMLANERDDNRFIGQDRRAGGSRQVWWHEDYIRYDLNGDGIAELLYVQRSTDYKVFAIQEMAEPDDHPFEDWSPFPMQHRRIGQSLADKVMDMERINTVILRQTLNGFYAGNNPSTYVHEDSIGENTIEDLLTVRPGRLVRWKGATPPVERQSTYDPAAGLSMLEYMERQKETRTGITRLNMGLDEDTLNDTAQGQAQLIARGEQVEEYVARNFANGVAKLFTKKAKLLQRYGQPITVPIDGEYREVDPSRWPEDMLARARVGLGVANKAQRLAARQAVLAMQAQAMAEGLSIVDEAKLFNSAKGFVSDSGLGDVSEFFNDPSKPQIDPGTGQPVQRQPKPDPAMAKVQSDAQLQQAKLESDTQLAQQKAAADAATQQAKLQSDAQLNAAKLDMQNQQATLSAQMAHEFAQFNAGLDAAKQQHAAWLAQSKAQAEADLAEQKTAIETHLAQQQMAIDAALAHHKNELDAKVKLNSLPANRPGGDLAE